LADFNDDRTFIITAQIQSVSIIQKLTRTASAFITSDHIIEPLVGT